MLARVISVGTEIEDISGTEYTEWVIQANFTATVASFIRDKNEADKETKKYVDGQNELSL